MSEPSPAYPSLSTEQETAAEAALYAWFAEQQLKSADNLEEAARQIITLCTALLGLLLGLLALAEDPLPAHMRWSGVQGLGVAGVVALLLALAAALTVVLPRPLTVTLNDPDALQAAFAGLLARKSRGLTWAVWLFAAGIFCLGAIVVIAVALIG